MLVYVLSDLLILVQFNFPFSEVGVLHEWISSEAVIDKDFLQCANRVQKERLKHGNNPSSVCLHWGQMSVPYTLETVWHQ